MSEAESVPSVSESVDKKTELINNKNEKKHKKFTCKQKIALVMLAVVDFMSFCSMSIMAPFYPQEAAKKGMNESMAGFVFGFYALVVFLSSPVFGKVLPKLGIKFLFTGGVLLSGVCSIVFGTLHLIDDYAWFTACSFLLRGLAALGASAYSTASYVIIVKVFPDNAGAVRGMLETFVGLGMSVGPAIGVLLFAVGGFGLPFYVIGLIIMLIAPLNVYLLPETKKCTALESKPGSFTKLLKITPVLVTSVIIIVIAMTWSFLDPTLEPHLRTFSLSPFQIGFIFLLESATYGIFSPIWGWLTDKMDNYWWLMTLGLFINGLCLLVMGPSPILWFLEDSIWLNIVSLSILGISVAMSLMPTYQSVLDSALSCGFEENLGTHSVIAGLWACVYSLGEVLGPILGGVLLQHFGFPIASTVMGVLNLVVAVLATAYFYSVMNTAKTTKEIEETQAYTLNDVPTIRNNSIIGNGHWNSKLN